MNYYYSFVLDSIIVYLLCHVRLNRCVMPLFQLRKH